MAGSTREERRRVGVGERTPRNAVAIHILVACLLYTSDAADERSSVDLGGRRIIKKKNNGSLRHYALAEASTSVRTTEHNKGAKSRR